MGNGSESPEPDHSGRLLELGVLGREDGPSGMDVKVTRQRNNDAKSGSCSIDEHAHEGSSGEGSRAEEFVSQSEEGEGDEPLHQCGEAYLPAMLEGVPSF